MFMQRVCVLAACFVIAAGACDADSLTVKIKNSGVADDSAAIQKSLDKCAATGGGTVTLPEGRYRLDKPINIPSGVSLAGVWEAPHHAQLDKGTVIFAYWGKNKENDPPLIKLNASSTIRGMSIFYPEQKIPAIPYPWTIQGEGMHCNVIDITLVNPYKGIDFGTHANELHHIRNVFGCPLKVGVFIDRCTDIGRLENVHFNPHYWGRAESKELPDWNKLIAYLFDNTTAFDIGRTDWEYILNTFSFGCKVGFRFFESKHGSANGNFLGNGVDWSRTAILVEQTQAPGLLFTNGEFVGPDDSEAMIDVKASNTGILQLTNCSFWGPAKRVARIAGNGSVSMSQCNINWLKVPADAGVIEASGGDITIQACRFGVNGTQIKLNPGVKTAVIMGNTMVSPIKIENTSTGDVQILANVTRANAK
ncbi:MAG: glycosyl hydrolase family 28-related protein [Armatimonadota bacterium]